MKKILILFIASVLFISCKTEKKAEKKVIKTKIEQLAPVSDTMLENSVIYEANIRQYSPEGTFEAFRKDIPVLKELGVKIIWVMPINPISKIKRKASGDVFTSDIKDIEERKKYLGSYYSVSEYKAINSEFGTLEDFKNLVNTAHKNGIYLIIDWVPNHTGWDHPWITAHPQYYTQNEKGEIIDPINPDTGKSWGWTDTADLNYENENMRKEMIADMKYWIDNTAIDGFRMDVAHKVPPAFFKEAVATMEKVRPIFMLAEAEQPELLKNGFDMQYAWEGHHILNKISKGEATVKDLDAYLQKLDTVLEKDDINMNFITNHDENSWSGTVKERMPNNKELFTALTYMLPGMPLIYSGQEYDLDYRLKFFEKDSIPKTRGEYFELLKKLGHLKNNNLAINGGKDAASYERMEVGNENIMLFRRSKGNDSVLFIGNFSNESMSFSIPVGGNFTDYIVGSKFLINEKQQLTFKPWEYKILRVEK